MILGAAAILELAAAAAIAIYALIDWPIVRGGPDQDDWPELRCNVDTPPLPVPPVYLLADGLEFELDGWDGWDHASIVRTLDEIESL